MDPLVARVKNELLANADEETRRSLQRFFKESVQCYGVKTPTVGKIAKKHWKEAARLGKQKIFALCNELLSSGFTEEAFVVSYWLPNLAEKLEPERSPAPRGDIR